MADIRLLIVDPSIDYTGALQCALQMSLALQDVAHCELVLPMGSKPLSITSSNVRAIHAVSLKNPGSSFYSILSWIISVLRSSVQLRWLLLSRGCTHLVINDWYLLQGVLCRVLGYRGKIITWVRLDPLRFGLLPSVIILRMIAFTSNHLVVVSRHVQRRLPMGISSTLLYDILPRPPLPAKPNLNHRLVFVGNYIPGKGQDVAIEAFSRIASDYNKLTLEFYGSTMGRPRNASWKSGLRARVEGLNLADRISFNDFVPDPRSVLQGAYAALNCSESESFSLTVLEASAAGVPVVSCACGGPTEIIVDGITGLLVPIGDVDGVAEAIKNLLDNPIRAHHMGAAAARHVQAKFDPGIYRLKLIRLLCGP